MRADLRVKYDIEARRAAIGLFERGHGFESAAKALSVPRNTVGQWLYAYRSFGSGVPPSMDGRQAGYAYEQKVAAASAVVDGGMGGPGATARSSSRTGPGRRIPAGSPARTPLRAGRSRPRPSPRSEPVPPDQGTLFF